MDFDVPTDLIYQSQIGFREGAGLSSFDPNDTTLPPLPTVEASISTFDPSSSHLRCKYCQGKLLRGVQSLICVYCGEYQKKDLHPDPISFNSTNGYNWLLQSLSLNGSERVGSFTEGSGLNGGQSPAEIEVTLSELLDFQISWQDEPKKPEKSFDDRTSEHISSIKLGTSDLNFFEESKRAIVSDTSKEQPISSKSDQNKAFGGQENLHLFQNVFPPETSVTSSSDVSSDPSSGWNAEFQFADTKMENENPKSAEPFIGVGADLSSQMDTVFGPLESFDNRKIDDHSDLFSSTSKDWIQDDPFADMSPATFQQAKPFESVVQPNDGLPVSLNDLSSKDEDEDWFSDRNWQQSSAKKTTVSQQADELDFLSNLNNGSSNPINSSTEGVSVDWFENTNWQKSTQNKVTTNKDDNLFDIKPQVDDLVQTDGLDFDNLKKPHSDTTTDWFHDSQWPIGASGATNMVANKDDDAFNDWNDFTSSTSNQGSLADSWKQSGNEKISEIDLFSSTPKEADFGNFSQFDLFSGSSSNKNANDAEAGFNVVSEVSTASRNVNSEADDETRNPKNDVQMLMSQMHDLSFMLKSELLIPSKADDVGPSHT